jgi:hypothetical protein
VPEVCLIVRLAMTVSFSASAYTIRARAVAKS